MLVWSRFGRPWPRLLFASDIRWPILTPHWGKNFFVMFLSICINQVLWVFAADGFFSHASGVVPRKTFKSTFLISLGIHLVKVHFRLINENTLLWGALVYWIFVLIVPMSSMPSQSKEREHLRPRTPRPVFWATWDAISSGVIANADIGLPTNLPMCTVKDLQIAQVWRSNPTYCAVWDENRSGKNFVSIINIEILFRLVFLTRNFVSIINTRLISWCICLDDFDRDGFM